MAATGSIIICKPFPNSVRGLASVTSFALDGATDELVFIFQAPDTGPVLTKALVRCGVLTGTSPTYVVSLRGVTDAYADGAIKGGASPVSVDLTPAAGDAGKVVEVAFANSYDSTGGEWLALCITPKAGTTIDGGNNWSFSHSGNAGTGYLPFAVTNNAGTKTPIVSDVLLFAVGDGSTWWGGNPIQSALAYATPNSSPVYAGAKLTLPAAMGDTVRIAGVLWYAYTTASQNLVAKLFDAADNELASATYDSDVSAGRATPGEHALHFAASVPITCGLAYRLVVTDTTGANTRVYYNDYAAAAHRDTAPWKQTFCWTQGTTGAWADTTTRVPLLFPIINDITEPASGGGYSGRHQYIGLGR